MSNGVAERAKKRTLMYSYFSTSPQKRSRLYFVVSRIGTNNTMFNGEKKIRSKRSIEKNNTWWRYYNNM